MSMRTKLAALGAAFLLFVTATGCSVLPETTTVEDLTPIEAKATSVAALEPEITALAKEQDEDAVLTKVEVVYQGNDAVTSRIGSITFTYYSAIPSEQRVTTTTIQYDMEEEAVFHLSTTESLQYFTSTPTEPISLEDDAPISATFDSLFEAIEQDQSFAAKLGGTNIKLTFVYTADEVELSII